MIYNSESKVQNPSLPQGSRREARALFAVDLSSGTWGQVCPKNIRLFLRLCTSQKHSTPTVPIPSVSLYIDSIVQNNDFLYYTLLRRVENLYTINFSNPCSLLNSYQYFFLLYPCVGLLYTIDEKMSHKNYRGVSQNVCGNHKLNIKCSYFTKTKGLLGLFIIALGPISHYLQFM